MAVRPILVLNAGSSSIKCALFDGDLREVLRVDATGIGEASGTIKTATNTAGEVKTPAVLADNDAALTAILAALEAAHVRLSDLRAVAHRVVHGGSTLTQTVRITEATRAEIAACIPLAPLHNPHHLAAIDAITARAPDLPQYVSFDTAFHATNPDVARAYALPEVAATQGMQRYGFHGNSYAALVRALAEETGGALPRRLLALHLGNGASLCAILDGRSVATTMGYSPTSGITMGTRTGDIDPAAVLSLARDLGLEGAADLLTRRAGLLGLSGISGDMRTLAASQDPKARFAIEHFCYWAARHAGSMITAMGGLDAVAFTGGIGENDRDIRDDILNRLTYAGNVPQFVIPAQEERHIAREAAELMETAPDDA